MMEDRIKGLEEEISKLQSVISQTAVSAQHRVQELENKLDRVLNILENGDLSALVSIDAKEVGKLLSSGDFLIKSSKEQQS